MQVYGVASDKQQGRSVSGIPDARKPQMMQNNTLHNSLISVKKNSESTNAVEVSVSKASYVVFINNLILIVVW